MRKHKRNGSRKHGLMNRSDIPYAQRIAMQQRNDIAVNRDHAAKIAMFCMSIAMHELEGIGYKRLVQFSLSFKELVDELYEDPEVGMAHAKHRMEQIGMPISGEFFYQKLEGRSARTQLMYDHALQAAQIALICGSIAMNDEFGFGAERLQRISNRVEELSQRYAHEGDKFLFDAMEKIGFPIVDGKVTAYIGEDGKAVMPSKAKREWC